MKPSVEKEVIYLTEPELKKYIAGNENICAALAGATLTSAMMSFAPGFFVFGAGFMLFCLEGHI